MREVSEGVKRDAASDLLRLAAVMARRMSEIDETTQTPRAEIHAGANYARLWDAILDSFSEAGITLAPLVHGARRGR